jgi:GT2 family glycosyltransferase
MKSIRNYIEIPHVNYLEPIAVILLSFNQFELLIPAIESVSIQSYQNISLYLIDDNSKAEEFNSNFIISYIKSINASSIKRFSLILNETNLGIVKSLNKALLSVKESYFTVVSGDDLLTENSIAQSYQKIRDKEYAIVGGLMMKLKGKDLQLHFAQVIFNETFFNSLSPKERYKFVSTGPLPFSRGGAMMRTDVIRVIGGYDEKYIHYDDRPLYIKLAKGGYDFGFVNEYLYIWRDNTGMSSNKSNPNNRLFMKDLLTLYSKEYYPNYRVLGMKPLKLIFLIIKYKMKIFHLDNTYLINRFKLNKH